MTDPVLPARVAVYCGSRMGHDERFQHAARALGATLADLGVGMVYGGASVGLMGVVATAALDRGGEVIGVLPEGLRHREHRHPGLTDMRMVGSMHERKALMTELADAVVALPGGIGTLDELAEALAWHSLGITRSPVGLLEVGGFWAPLVSLLDGFVATGFMSQERRDALCFDEDAERLVRALGSGAGLTDDGVWRAG